MSKAGARAVFLPEVPLEQGWDKTRWLEELSQKAGLAKNAWKSGARFEAFTTQTLERASSSPLTGIDPTDVPRALAARETLAGRVKRATTELDEWRRFETIKLRGFGNPASGEGGGLVTWSR